MNKKVLVLAALMASPAYAGNGIVHEWGTYTSMQGSDGINVEGLQHEEESLPGFVHGRAKPTGSFARTCPQGEKCLNHHFFAQPIGTGVTQKLETPVIYFYGMTGPTTVKVDFPKGVISQWYPASSAATPSLDSESLSGGSMTWNVNLIPGNLNIPAVSPTDIWAPSRLPNSTYVQSGSENEKFIFYRGLGRFDVPFSVTTSAHGRMTLHNSSAEPIQAAFLLSFDGTQGFVRTLGSLNAHQDLDIPSYLPGGKEPRGTEMYVAQAKDEVRQALIKSGLTPNEALAMVGTWERSYFRTPGLRVLYIAPRKWTDELLPLQISPAPQRLVRTLVGRVEIFAKDDETALANGQNLLNLSVEELNRKFGRLSEAKLRRLQTLSTDYDVKAQLQSLIDQMN